VPEDVVAVCGGVPKGGDEGARHVKAVWLPRLPELTCSLPSLSLVHVLMGHWIADWQQLGR
jgi:hypothetical protein